MGVNTVTYKVTGKNGNISSTNSINISEGLGPVMYTIKSGDTLNSIAKRYNIDVNLLYEDNKDLIGDDPGKIFPGQELIIRSKDDIPVSDEVVIAEPRQVKEPINIADMPSPVDEKLSQRTQDMTIEPVNSFVSTSVPGSLSPGTTKDTFEGKSYNLSDDDYKVLCSLVYSEAVEGNSYCYSDTMAVTSTILNRVESPSYPSSIFGVASQKSQFSGYQNKKYNAAYNNPGVISDVMKQAIDDTLKGARNTSGCSFRGHGTYNSFF